LAWLWCDGVTADWAAQPARRQAVKEAFLRNYAHYERSAFGYDVLRPINDDGVNEDSTAGFGATIVDAMSTMHVMDLARQNGVVKHVSQPAAPYGRALQHVKSLDFSMTHTNYEGYAVGVVSPFELTIRYIGGMLSAYQLGGENAKESFLVEQAATLADILTKAWPQGSQLPARKFNLNSRRPVLSEPTTLADAGSLTLEWHMLSQMTGNETYGRMAKGAVDKILATQAVFPGLYAQTIWPHNGRRSRDYVTWGGGTDSFLEYLIKYPLLIGDRQHSYLNVYEAAINSTIEHLLHKTGQGDLTFLGDWSQYYAQGPLYVHSHLACFAGGNIALAGQAMGNGNWTRIGLEIAESCAVTYARTSTGLGPISWGWYDGKGDTHGWPDGISAARKRFYVVNGFFIESASWLQQPEVTESVFYAWRITRQERWRELAWQAFLAMRRQFEDSDAAQKTAWSCVQNVNDDSTATVDVQQSFLYAELFKYLYLIFDDPKRFSLDDYVFTTEAHPFRRKKDKQFGPIQDAPFAYQWLSADFHSAAMGQSWQGDVAAYPAHIEELAAKKSFTGSLLCNTHDVHSKLTGLPCSFPIHLLALPVVFLVVYKASVWLGKRMKAFERSMYRTRRTDSVV
jgi:mannosyl-oligosaccharide alpha-1,2-mannosidase